MNPHDTPGDASPPIPDTNRRQFLAGLSATALVGSAGALIPSNEAHGQVKTAQADAPPTSLIDSPPVLQNPLPDAMTVAWAIRGPATGWVEYGPTPELGLRADAPRHGLNPLSSRFLHATMTGLQPGQKVYYRICAAPIKFHNAYRIERGPAVTGERFEFITPDAAAATADFAVINDTHQNEATLKSLAAQLAKKPADYTIWNGDVFNDIYTDDQIVEHVLRPTGSAYAARKPVLFTAGNHDHRGPLARQLSHAFTPWAGEEPLGRCFAVRHGPLAMIGLDTGEDKPDHHPVFAGLANFQAYHKAQRDWLAAALKRPAIAEAPYLVAFCHIPLFGRPGHNGGDTLEGYAYYAKHAQQLWHPLLQQAGVQLIISGHMHQYRFDAPTATRSYGQIVGGGPKPEAATLIRGGADGKQMEVVAAKLDETELGRWTFKPR